MQLTTWEGARNPLQLSGWAVTHVDTRLTTGGRRERVFEVVRIADPKPPAPCPRLGCEEAGYTLDGRDPSAKGLRVVDTPSLGCAVSWSIRRSRFRCRSCGRRNVEQLPLYVDGVSGMTARAYLYVRMQAANRPYLAVAQEMGIAQSRVSSIMRHGRSLRSRRPDQAPKPSKPTAPDGMPIVRAEADGRPWVGESRVPRYLGLDEVALVDRKNGQAHLKQPRTVMVDLESGNLVAMFLDNRKTTIVSWFAGLEAWERSRILGVSIDMDRDYRATVRAALGDGVPIVIDRFHVDRMAQDAADLVRRREVEAAPRKARSKVRNRHVDDDVRMFARMLRSRRLPRTPERRELLRTYLRSHPLTYVAVRARQDFRAIFETARGEEEAKARLEAWAEGLHEAIRPAFAGVERALRVFGPEILTYFDLPISNGLTESANGMIKRLMRAGPSAHIETLRDRMLVRGRYRPTTSVLCDDCRTWCEDPTVYAGPSQEGVAGRFACATCATGVKRPREHRPTETLRDLFVGGSYKDRRRMLSRREAIRRRNEQLPMIFELPSDEPVIGPSDMLLLDWPTTKTRGRRKKLAPAVSTAEQETAEVA